MVLFRVVAVGIATAAALVAIELLLQFVPALLPERFRDRYPPHGVEFFAPGVLDRTPLEAVPQPTGLRPYDGPPPHDIADVGVTRRGIELDRADVPRLVLPVDAEGFVNDTASGPEPDVVLVGDSFAALAGQSEPPGLIAGLRRELGLRVHNFGVVGSGPDQGLWLLQQRALPLRPRVVVWFIYGGNDFLNAHFLRTARAGGAVTHGDQQRDARRPLVILPSLVASWLAGEPEPMHDELPPVEVAGCDETVTWFHPDTLRFQALPLSVMSESEAWAGIAAALDTANAACAAANARLLVVYLPSKEQLVLPLCVEDAGLLPRYLARSMLQPIPVPSRAEELLPLLRANCGNFEGLVVDHCRANGIACWSATDVLRRAVAACVEVYYRADSHWRAEGQAAVLPGLVEQLRALGSGRPR